MNYFETSRLLVWFYSYDVISKIVAHLLAEPIAILFWLEISQHKTRSCSRCFQNNIELLNRKPKFSLFLHGKDLVQKGFSKDSCIDLFRCQQTTFQMDGIATTELVLRENEFDIYKMEKQYSDIQYDHYLGYWYFWFQKKKGNANHFNFSIYPTAIHDSPGHTWKHQMG